LGKRAVLGIAAACSLAITSAAGADVVPPFPTRHLDDRAGFVSPAVAARLDSRLREFETRTGHAVYVSIFPKLPSASLEDFTIRTATAWRVGRKGLDDGVILFAFVADRKLRLEVGYGLEAIIPDAIAHRILDEHVTPGLKAGHPDAAFEGGVAALLAAAEGLPLPTPNAESNQDDVPIPETRGLLDKAGLLNAEAAAQVREQLAQMEQETGCVLAIDLENGPPPSARYSDAQLFAVRSFFRAHPMTENAADRRAEEQRHTPNALLFVFVTSRQPLEASIGYFGSCLREEVGIGVIQEALEPRFGADPGAALRAALDLHLRAQRGEWTPPSPTPEPSPEPRALGRLDSIMAAVTAIASFKILGLPVGLAFLIVAFPLSTSPVLRFLPIRRRWKRGEALPRAWVIESLILLWIIVSNLGSSRSGGSTTSSGRSSSSGGGGRFGGGGASGSW
jgi:uncharacterized membrane protein YgcG